MERAHKSLRRPRESVSRPPAGRGAGDRVGQADSENGCGHIGVAVGGDRAEQRCPRGPTSPYSGRADVRRPPGRQRGREVNVGSGNQKRGIGYRHIERRRRVVRDGPGVEERSRRAVARAVDAPPRRPGASGRDRQRERLVAARRRQRAGRGARHRLASRGAEEGRRADVRADGDRAARGDRAGRRGGREEVGRVRHVERVVGHRAPANGVEVVPLARRRVEDDGTLHRLAPDDLAVCRRGRERVPDVADDHASGRGDLPRGPVVGLQRRGRRRRVEPKLPRDRRGRCGRAPVDPDRERVRGVSDEARVGLLFDLGGSDALRVERRRGEEEGEEEGEFLHALPHSGAAHRERGSRGVRVAKEDQATDAHVGPAPIVGGLHGVVPEGEDGVRHFDEPRVWGVCVAVLREHGRARRELLPRPVAGVGQRRKVGVGITPPEGEVLQAVACSASVVVRVLIVEARHDGWGHEVEVETLPGDGGGVPRIPGVAAGQREVGISREDQLIVAVEVRRGLEGRRKERRDEEVAAHGVSPSRH